MKRITLNVNPAPPVLTASRKTIYVSNSTMLTATGLPADVGANVVFRFVGHLDYSSNCDNGIVRAPRNNVSRTATFTARTTAYGCAPGGDTTVFLETTDGHPLASIDIFVRLPELHISPDPINIGQSATINASNIFNGPSVQFEIDGPGDFSASCTGVSSSLIGSPPVIVNGTTATKDLFGCSPGGTAIVTMKKNRWHVPQQHNRNGQSAERSGADRLPKCLA